MSRHPEKFPRGSGGVPYDPDEPLVVRWADVISARNAAMALLVVLNDPELELDATSRNVGWQVRDWLPMAVVDGPGETLQTRDDAIEWLQALVQRLNRSLP